MYSILWAAVVAVFGFVGAIATVLVLPNDQWLARLLLLLLTVGAMLAGVWLFVAEVRKRRAAPVQQQDDSSVSFDRGRGLRVTNFRTNAKVLGRDVEDSDFDDITHDVK